MKNTKELSHSDARWGTLQAGKNSPIQREVPRMALPGRRPRGSPRTALVVQVDLDTKRWLRRVAETNHTTITNIVNEALTALRRVRAAGASEEFEADA